MFLKRLESESITDYILRAENISNSLCSDMTNGSVSQKHMWVYILHIRGHLPIYQTNVFERLESESITDYILRAENISNSLCSDMTNGSVSQKHMWVYILHIRGHLPIYQTNVFEKIGIRIYYRLYSKSREYF